MITDAIKRLDEEIAGLTLAVKHAHPVADVGLEIARLTFLLQQKRSQQMAIYFNTLAVCDRLGLEPSVERPYPYG